MVVSSDSGGARSPLSGTVARNDVTMDLTMCGLLVDRAEELAGLYREHGNWNDVKEHWFDERLSDRSTRDSSQKIFGVLSGRFKNAPENLPNPRELPVLLENCNSQRAKSQVLYFYLVADDALVHYTVGEYVQRMADDVTNALDFSDESLFTILSDLSYADGSSFDYADSTTQRWCEGFRSVMRKIGVLEERSINGSPPEIGEVPLLVAMGYSYDDGDSDWVEEPTGLQILFQPRERWEECFDRAAETDAWEYVETAGELTLRPSGNDVFSISQGGDR
jgi:hypothetical protein